MRVLVCGGRDWVTSLSRVNLIHQVLSALHPRPDILIVGGDDKEYKAGVDAAAYLWAMNHAKIPVAVCPPNWNAWRRAAGPIRNAGMLLLQPELVIAFPGGTGTADMVRKARLAGVPVREIEGTKREGYS